MHHSEGDDKKILGFWLYLMTDLIMFAVGFAGFAVLRNNTAGGPSGKELFDLSYVLIETLILLTSSFIAGLGMLSVHTQSKRGVLTWFGITGMLGLSFLGMELYEFHHLIEEGHTWQSSAFLSSFFTLVGMHGLHITAGLVWLLILLIYVAVKGITTNVTSKLNLLSIFWHFLDVVWIFIFTIVYLMGAL